VVLLDVLLEAPALAPFNEVFALLDDKLQ